MIAAKRAGAPMPKVTASAIESPVPASSLQLE